MTNLEKVIDWMEKRQRSEWRTDDFKRHIDDCGLLAAFVTDVFPDTQTTDMNIIDTEHRDDPICPKCGKVVCDRIDLPTDMESGQTNCWNCGTEVRWARNVTVTYSTEVAYD